MSAVMVTVRAIAVGENGAIAQGHAIASGPVDRKVLVDLVNSMSFDTPLVPMRVAEITTNRLVIGYDSVVVPDGLVRRDTLHSGEVEITISRGADHAGCVDYEMVMHALVNVAQGLLQLYPEMVGELARPALA